VKASSARITVYSLRIEEPEPGDIVVFISGRLSLTEFNSFSSDLRSMLNGRSFHRLTLNLGGITYLDSAGTLALYQLEEEYRERSVPVVLQDASERITGILNLLNRKAHHISPLIPPRKSTHALERIGEATRMMGADFFLVMSFVGKLLTAMLGSFCNPSSIRWREVLFYMKSTGVDGLPIVGLISLLLGLIMAFMSSLQLRQFGAGIYVASLLAMAMVKELGPIMTAIIVAGRSGSAFAAEIGTMIVNDEVNALETMGFEPTRFLAVPKVLASMLVVPLLTIYADLFALLGGLLVGVFGLDLTAHTYIQQTRESIDVSDVFSSLIKAMVFAALIAGIGCQRGFQVRGDAASVGRSTTSAVVSAIFLIIVADSAFAIILHYIG